MIINKFSLKWMLAIAVAIPAIALLFLAFTSLNTMSVMQAQSNSLYANTAAPMRAMAEATSRMPRMRVGIDMMLLQETALKDAKGFSNESKRQEPKISQKCVKQYKLRLIRK